MIEPRLDPPIERLPLWSRIGWMMLIWTASVLALALVGVLIRAWLNA